MALLKMIYFIKYECFTDHRWITTDLHKDMGFKKNENTVQMDTVILFLFKYTSIDPQEIKF